MPTKDYCVTARFYCRPGPKVYLFRMDKILKTRFATIKGTSEFFCDQLANSAVKGGGGGGGWSQQSVN